MGLKVPIIYATPPTIELCGVMLPDSAYIQEMEVERKNRKNRRAGRNLIEPIYTVEDACKAQSYFKAVNYDEIIQLTPDVRMRFVDAGHILGSAMIEICINEDGCRDQAGLFRRYRQQRPADCQRSVIY
ncbi:MAG: hypothetical protein RQM92_04115 [Candidatus Syntrophopropionicum ammoniitolerans]